MMSQVVLVDGLNLAWRMNFAHMSLSTSKGVRTGVMYGILKSILDLTRKIGDCDIIYFWEGGRGDDPTADSVKLWRKKLHKSYKANRSFNKDRESVMQQVDLSMNALELLGYSQFYIPGLEGDDLIGVVSKVLEDDADVKKVYILSNDRDFFQCITSKVHVLRPGNGKIEHVTSKKVFEEFQITPEQWAAYRALTGDSSDNIKGMPGCGPVKALQLIRAGLDEEFHCDGSTSQKLPSRFDHVAQHWEEIAKCYVLTYIPRSVTFPHFPEESRRTLKQQLKQLPNMRRRMIPRHKYEEVLERWTRFCAKYELESFLAKRRHFFATVSLT